MTLWLCTAILSMLAFSYSDLLGKKIVAAGSKNAPIEMMLSMLILAFGISLVLFASGAGESGDSPWRILQKNPLIFANHCCFLLYWLFYLVCFRYIGLAVESSFSGINGILYFFGLVLVNAVSGKLISVQKILHPARLIPVLILLALTFLLPNVELFARRSTGALLKKMMQERHNTIIGLLILFAALVFDAGDSLLTTLIFDDGTLGVVDYTMANHFATLLPVLLLLLYLRKKNGRWFIPFRDDVKNSICYSIVANLSSLLYLYASSLNAVYTGIVFIVQPVVPIIGAILLLKERYTWRQNLCIWGIVLAAIAFCATDYIIR